LSLEAQRLDAIRKIMLDHKGRSNPIKSSEIRKRLSIPDNDTSGATRALITKLILDEGMPIAATSNGYFYIETQQELAEYMAHLQDRITNTTNRMVTVFANYKVKNGNAKIAKKLGDF
jgi:hypothetical protein